MARKSYKDKYAQLLYESSLNKTLLANLTVDKEANKIDLHTKKYIHIPFSWAGIGRLFALLGSIGLAIANFLLIIEVGNEKKVWELLTSTTPKDAYSSFSQLIILYPIVGQYLLIGLSFICFAALIKGGFNKLKSYEDEEGLIYGLIGGLIFGLIYGLIGGLIFGLIYGLIFGLIYGLIGGLIFGLIGGLIGGLIFGLIYGLIKELEK